MAERSGAETALLVLGAALVLTLLGIGVASGEMIRHLIQATPVAMLTGLAWRRPGWERWLLGPPFVFWLLIAVGIGLFLAGLRSPLSGTFNAGERAGVAALATIGIVGFALFPRIRHPEPLWIGLLLSAAALALQVAAMALSVQPAFAHR